MGADHALVEDDAALRVDAGGDIGGGDLARRVAQFVRVLRQGQRVQVDDAEDALVIVLQRDPVADRAEIIAEMQIAGRLDAGKNAVHRTSLAILADAAAGCYRCPGAGRVKPVGGGNWPRSSRQRSTPSSQRPAPPKTTERRRRSAAPARRAASPMAPASAGSSSRRRPEHEPPCRAPPRRSAAGCARARRSSRKWPRRRSSTSRASACSQPDEGQRQRHADMRQKLHQPDASAPDWRPSRRPRP